jgi:UDP-N-acetylmuramoyl-tripeptide--D-alanyl-D-alanine ligase
MAVIEMGTNAPGEIASLAAIALPDYGIVTNVGETHLEGLGSVEGVARAKGELVETLGDNGVAFLNADDPWSDALARRHRGPNVFFGRSARADVRCVEARRTETGHCFRLADGHEFELNVPGLHNVHNALAALAVCRELGILDDVCDALASFRLPDLRYQAQQFGQVSVIADCYNANLGSMTAALDEFDAMAAPGRRVMVCGDMLEMGPHAERVHRQLGRRVGRSRVDRLWAIGPAGTWVVEAARGERPLAAEHRPDADEAIAEVVASVEPLDTVLVKGSRGMKMERVVEAIRLRYAETAGTAEGPLRRD